MGKGGERTGFDSKVISGYGTLEPTFQTSVDALLVQTNCKDDMFAVKDAMSN